MAKSRRGRLAAEYARKGPAREPYDFVLIVCEGAKTEPNYFQGLRRTFRLSNANIVIGDPDGNDPISIVRYAEAELSRDAGYDRAYCVFDRDGHANYQAALTRLSQSAFGRAKRLFAIASVPCFEIWLLLHFTFTTAPFNSADEVIRELRRSFPRYTKGAQGCFEYLAAHLDTAIGHANRLETHNRTSRSDNPATKMHELVRYLRGLKSDK